METMGTPLYQKIREATFKPQRFFENLPVKTSYWKALLFVYTMWLLYSIGIMLPLLIFFPDWITLLKAIATPLGLLLASLSLIISGLLLFVLAGCIHIALKLLKGTAPFKSTFLATAYSTAMYAFLSIPATLGIIGVWIGGIGLILTGICYLAIIIGAYYGFYVAIVGLSVYHKITKLRAFGGFVLGYIFHTVIFLILLLIIILAILFVQKIYSPLTPSTSQFFSSSPALISETSTTAYPAFKNITAYLGTAPMIDGIITPTDGWFEGGTLSFVKNAVQYSILTKHDRKNLYVSIIFPDTPTWEHAFALYFEQDGTTHDSLLTNGRTDGKYQGAGGPNSWRDAHWKEGWTVADEYESLGKLDGDMHTVYNGTHWNVEWSIPLNSGDEYDIGVDRFPANVGFSIVDWGGGVAQGFWPMYSNPYKTDTWGELILLEKRT